MHSSRETSKRLLLTYHIGSKPTPPRFEGAPNPPVLHSGILSPATPAVMELLLEVGASRPCTHTMQHPPWTHGSCWLPHQGPVPSPSCPSPPTSCKKPHWGLHSALATGDSSGSKLHVPVCGLRLLSLHSYTGPKEGPCLVLAPYLVSYLCCSITPAS